MGVLPACLAALFASALLLRRRPLTALAVTLAGPAAIMMLMPPTAASAVAPQIIVGCAAGMEICYLAATLRRAVSLTCAAVATAGLLISLQESPSLGSPLAGNTGRPLITIAVPLVMIIAWLIGHSIRQAHTQAELLRSQAAAQSAMEERLRIARELHDIVAHSIGIIAIQAGAGSRVFDARPAAARDALEAIEATSRDTLSGLRRMVTGLRRADLDPGLRQATLDPMPGLAGIEQLAATTRDAGVQVDVDWHGHREPLPADVDLAAFRIVQEAVTNVVRHAGSTRCRVSVDQQNTQLSIEITDDGRGCSATGTGYGITGMRERAALLGGDLSAGPCPGGGFRVAARLPVPVNASAP